MGTKKMTLGRGRCIWAKQKPGARIGSRPCLVARVKGLEPLTYWFVASHSIQLSYTRMKTTP